MPKMKKIYSMLATTVLMGFIAGIICALYYVTCNQYIGYKLFRLIILAFQKSLNRSIFYFGIGSLILYSLCALNTKKLECNKNKILQFEIIAIVILIAFLLIDFLLQHFSNYTVAYALKRFINELKYSSSHRTEFNDWIRTIVRYAKIGIIPGITSIVFVVSLWRLFMKYRIDRLIERIDARYIEKIALVLVVFLLILNLFVIVDATINAPTAPNIVLIFCDALRPDHLGYYGYSRDTSRNIDLLAKRSFVFKNAYSQAPSTVPSMWNMMTSKYLSTVPTQYRSVTISEYLKSKNYKTAAFISQHFLKGMSANLYQGFDIYDSRCDEDKHRLTTRTAGSVTSAAIKWIRQNQKQPLFIWLVYFDPHNPYFAPEGFRDYYNEKEEFSIDVMAEHAQYNNLPPGERKRFLINAYDEEVRYFDHEVGKIFAYLKHLGQYDNSIIILTADHGEELGDNEDVWGHGNALSQANMKIPLLIKMPYQKKQAEIQEAVQSIDVYPSIVEYLDRKNLPLYYGTLEGRSLMPLLMGEKSENDWFAVSFCLGQRSIVMGDYKYWLRNGKEYFINIKTNQNIRGAVLQNTLRNRLEKVFNKYISKKDYYEEIVNRLKSIGYLQ